jgi:iron-sulfur cluster assembly protein
MGKQIVTLTSSAVKRVRELNELNAGRFLRLGTRSAGCSGIKYDFSYSDVQNSADIEVEMDGVRIFIDSMSLIHVFGTEIDWVEKGLSRSFEFRNPNETARCGCGESFTTEKCQVSA